MAKFSDKRSRVERGGKRPGVWLVVILVAAGILAGAAWFALRPPGGAVQLGPWKGQETAGRPKVIGMTDIEARTEGGKIVVPLTSVKEKGLVAFKYKGKQEITLLSYIAPSGKVVTAVSLCEPCASTRFFIQDRSIVCATCYSQWDLETLKGIRGGCLKYPPDPIPNSVEGGNILIDESAVAQWKPRV